MTTKETHEEKDMQQKLVTTPIAIIGIASLFPDARTLSEYWDNILNKIDSIIDVPASRWNVADYYDPNPAADDKTYCKRGAFIPDVEFDPAEFGIPPNMLEVTDVSQLLSLVVAKECLQDGGYGEDRQYLHEKTGVILGMVGINSKLAVQLMNRLQYPVWEKVLLSYGISKEDTEKIIQKIKLAYPKWEENSFPGSIGNVVAGRIANRLDLGAINCVVDAACGSSLAAVRMAASELIEGRADMMITGGVDTDNSVGTYMCFSKTPAFSKGENVSPFDQDSDGMMAGEGIGMVLLKRLADAKKDGDRVYAVITGIGTSSDGRYKSIYAPRPAGQAVALQRTYKEAGYSPDTVGLIEAHGTGTTAGDPAEFEGLNEVFSSENPRRQHIALGSVKSQIGHTKAAAGVAGLIKAALALQQKVLPPTINITSPNSKLVIENTPFYLNTERRPWIKPAKFPRRAGVSAFGFGGTNFHVALEENEVEHEDPYRLQKTVKIILISASSPNDLVQEIRKWSEKLQTGDRNAEFSEMVRESQANTIHINDARLGFTAKDPDDARRQLKISIDILNNIGNAESAEHPSGIYYRRHGIDPQDKLVALFPGQGSQYVNMGLGLAISFPPIRQAFADMDAYFDADGQSPLSETIYPIPAFDNTTKDLQNQRLTRTEYAQPAIGTFSLGLYRLFKKAGFEADFTAGHSFGELTALWAAGVVDDGGFYTLAKARGKAMAAPDDPRYDAGTMLAVKGDINPLQEDLLHFPEITLANKNSRDQVVLAGPKSAIEKIEKLLADKGYSVVPLSVSAAFHTPLVAHAHQPFADAIQKVKFNKPAIKVYSNTTGKKYSADPDQIRKTLADHILKPVLFKDEIEAIYASGGSIFIEFGPKNVLTKLVKNILEGRPHTAIAINPNPKQDSDQQLRDAVMQMCVLGLDMRRFDPYALPEVKRSQNTNSSASLLLNGGLYLTEKTRTAFSEAITKKEALAVAPDNRMAPPTKSLSVPEEEHIQLNHSLFMNQLQSLHADALHVHNHFLSNDTDYISGHTKLMQHSLDLLSENTDLRVLEQINSAIQTLNSSMNQFHQHQSETLRMHEKYLQYQDGLIKNFLQFSNASGSLEPAELEMPIHHPSSLDIEDSFSLSTQPTTDPRIEINSAISSPDEGIPAAGTAENQANQLPAQLTHPTLKEEDLKSLLLEVVSEKTGYPAEMLDLGMDMEADLGIDSIKRVEIMGAIQARFPDFSMDGALFLDDLRTLGQIVDFMKNSAGSNTSDEVQDVLLNNTVGAHTDLFIEDVTEAFIRVVSEKTGYPTEMLELEMDMEADLGIDSIKRVEILGAMQAAFPELAKIEMSNLSHLHTLKEIIESMIAAEDSGRPQEEIPQVTFEHSVNDADEIFRGVAALKMIPAPDYQDIQINDNDICLILDDGADLTIALADRLIGDGKKVVVLQFPQDILIQRVLPEYFASVQLTDLSEIRLQDSLTAIQNEHGRIAVFIHLDPVANQSEFLSEKEKTIVKTVFLIAKNLQEPLNTAAQEGFAGFMTVTRMDGNFGLSSSGFAEPLSGSLFGLVKTLDLEWDHVYCRAVDLEPGLDAQTAAGLIMAELHDPNRLISEISYSSGERFTLLVDESITELDHDGKLLINSDSVILVSGGARGITARCVAALAKHTPCKFILLGRTNIIQALPEWAENCSDDAELKHHIMNHLIEEGQKPTPQSVDLTFLSLRAQEEVRATLEEIREAGADAAYIHADITDPVETLQSLLAEPIQRFGKISGVIHGAGALTDRRIEKKTSIDFDRVYSPKVTGLQNLLQLAPPSQLDFLILFSSVVGLFGNIGQSDYAMANEGLNKAAFQIKRENPTCHVLSINWGPWDSGMVTIELKREFEKRNMSIISSRAGARFLVDELTTNNKGGEQSVQIVAGALPSRSPQTLPTTMQKFRSRRNMSLDTNPFLLDHRIGINPVLPATCAASWITSSCEQLYPGFKLHLIEDFKVLKGIVFDDTLAEEYFLDMEENEKIRGEKVKLFGRVWSKLQNGRPLYHYSLNATLLSEPLPPPVHNLPVKFFSEQLEDGSGARLYQDGTLFHGPSFQGVSRLLDISETSVALECRLPQICAKQQGQFPVLASNPFMSDVIVQSLLIWTQKYYQAPCLPSNLASLEQHKVVPFDETCFVDLQIVTHSEYAVVADIWVTNRQGDVYMKFNGLEGTISTSLKRLLSVSVLENSFENINE